MRIPVFEIEKWPFSELEIQATYFSIDDNKDKPSLTRDPKDVTVDESLTDLLRVCSQ